MIFHHESILTDKNRTILGLVSQQPLSYIQHLAALSSRVMGLVQNQSSSAYAAIESYLHFSPQSHLPEEMAYDIMQCEQMTAFLTDVRHNWQSVTREEMKAYYKAIEESKDTVLPSVVTKYSQRELEGLKETYTLSEFLEVLSQYN